MKTYRVGGAVRDTLLDHPFSETDWVVVGSTPEAMLALGYISTGKINGLSRVDFLTE